MLAYNAFIRFVHSSIEGKSGFLRIGAENYQKTSDTANIQLKPVTYPRKRHLGFRLKISAHNLMPKPQNLKTKCSTCSFASGQTLQAHLLN
jgi:hypothetical protein